MGTREGRLRCGATPPRGWTSRATRSLCPECLAVIPALLVRRDGRIVMEKSCPQHGCFRELISSDADFFMRLERLAGEGDDASAAEDDGSASAAADADGCPTRCGLCADHLSRAMMINIDLTNRCNLRCPICFASSDARGYVFEVTREQVREMMARAVRANDPPPPCIQFSGGEPTLHPDLPGILADARAMGFAQIQIATNGLRLAREPDFARACADAGLNILYLQFDGLSDDVYRRTRGVPLVDVKYRAIENAYRAGIRTCLVPTIVKGLNDDQVGPILRFAVDRSDWITAVAWQPVAFTGRIDESQRAAQRFTTADLARCVEEQTGLVRMQDWYPYAFVEPFARLIEAVTGERTARMNCHAHCGMATYLLVNPATREAAALPQLVDVEGLMARIDGLADGVRRGGRLGNWWRLLRARREAGRFCRSDARVTGWDAAALSWFMETFVNFSARYPDNASRLRELHAPPWRMVLLAAMHFQDAYNFEIDRVRRCVVHYAAPDGRMYPFCTYNGGPYFRDRVERRFGRAPRAAGQTAAEVTGRHRS